MKSPIQKVQDKIARMKIRGNNNLNDLEEFLNDLIEDEKYEFAQAWIEGNKEGWNMTSDFPEDGFAYYNNRFNEQ